MCLNPQGAIELPASAGLVNPRVSDLAGKKIAIIWDGKKGGDNFCVAVEELLKTKYPTATTMRLVWGDAEAAASSQERDGYVHLRRRRQRHGRMDPVPAGRRAGETRQAGRFRGR